MAAITDKMLADARYAGMTTQFMEKPAAVPALTNGARSDTVSFSFAVFPLRIS